MYPNSFRIMIGPIGYLFMPTPNPTKALSTISKIQLHNPILKIEIIKWELPNITHNVYHVKLLIMHELGDQISLIDYNFHWFKPKF